MSGDGLSHALRSLLAQHMPSMDHVVLLLALRREPDGEHDPASLGAETRVDREVVDRVMRDLVQSRLVRREGDAFRYVPPADMMGAIEEVDLYYRTKPVTLVRAIYAQPARVPQTFADAFRLRKPGTSS